MKKNTLQTKIAQILWQDWDPIGVNSCETCRDEYSGYISSITALLQSGADILKIAKLLHQHANVNMGLSTKLEQHLEVACKLHTLMEKQ